MLIGPHATVYRSVRSSKVAKGDGFSGKIGRREAKGNHSFGNRQRWCCEQTGVK